MERMPGAGEIYRHFKGNLYQIVTVATHSETGEKLVVYQALYGNYGVYARPLQMFVSEVDCRKYPEAEQRYRFEKVGDIGDVPEKEEHFGDARSDSFEKMADAGDVSERTESHTDAQMMEQKETDRQEETEEDSVNAKMMAFFDADDLEDKYNILVSMRDEITDHMINNMAVVMDVVISEGDIDERYEELKRCIQTKQRYERERLR